MGSSVGPSASSVSLSVVHAACAKTAAAHRWGLGINVIGKLSGSGKSGLCPEHKRKGCC